MGPLARIIRARIFLSNANALAPQVSVAAQRRQILAAVTLAVVAASPLAAQNIEWIRQYPAKGEGLDVAADDFGNALIVGGAAGNGVYALDSDGFIAKYDSAGQLKWNKTIKSNQSDDAYAVASDSTGNAYVAGTTAGNLAAPNPNAYGDAFLFKYDSLGNVTWKRQWGTTANSEDGRGVAVNYLGDVYTSPTYMESGTVASGSPVDEVVNRYDTAGNLVSSHRRSSARFEFVQNVAADRQGNVFTTGRAQASSLGHDGSNIYISKYDRDGNFRWNKEIESPTSDIGYDVAINHFGNAYIVGTTDGDGTSAGGADVFLAKYDTNGGQLWAREFGTSDNDGGRGVFADSRNFLYVVGFTPGSLYGPNAGSLDAYLAKYDSDGNRIWGLQFGSNEADAAFGVAVDSYYNIYVTGVTFGSLGGIANTIERLFIAKLIDPARFGDFNNDQIVNAADYTAWRNGLGTHYTMADYANWKNNFGRVLSHGSAASVPEPFSGTLFYAAIASGLLARLARPFRTSRAEVTA